MSTTTDTSTTTVEPDAAVADGTAAVDTDVTVTAETGAQADSGAEDQDDGGAEVDEDQDDDDGAGKGGREAAKYRRRLREAEAQRDQLAGQVEAMQRAEVERLATADGLKPAALWAGAELAGLLADDGTVDGAKVSAAIEAAREQLGIPAPPVGPRVPNEGRSPVRPAKPSGREAMVGIVMGRGVTGDD